MQLPAHTERAPTTCCNNYGLLLRQDLMKQRMPYFKTAILCYNGLTRRICITLATLFLEFKTVVLWLWLNLSAIVARSSNLNSIQ